MPEKQMIEYLHNNGPAMRLQEELMRTSVISSEFKSFINEMVRWALIIERKEAKDPFIANYDPETGKRC